MRSPHTATVFSYQGETDGVAAYIPIHIIGVRFDTKEGVANNTVGQRSKNTNMLYVYFEDVATAKPYLQPWELCKLPVEQRGSYWTIHPGDDLFCNSKADTVDEYCAKVLDVVHCYDSEGDLHHLEIMGA